MFSETVFLCFDIDPFCILDGVIATIYLLGALNIIVPGMILDRYGPVPVSCFSLILTVISHGAIWLVSMVDPFAAHEYVLYILFFFAGKYYIICKKLRKKGGKS